MACSNRYLSFILKILLLKEEKILAEYFGEAYLNYRKKVNSIIPNPKILIFLFRFLKEKEGHLSNPYKTRGNFTIILMVNQCKLLSNEKTA